MSESAAGNGAGIAVSHHYGGRQDEPLRSRLRAAYRAAGRDPDDLGPAEMAGIDQLHLGGRGASLALMALGGIAPGDRVLDVGCGTGGASRLLAAELGCTVTGVDITANFIAVARWLSDACGLGGLTHFGCADAACLPLASGSVDVVWCQHALLNMPEPERVMAQWHRVLAPGGKLLLHEVVSGGNPAPLALPVPWASGESHSHLASLDQLQDRLAAAGFRGQQQRDVSAEALAWRAHHGRREGDDPVARPAASTGSGAGLPGPEAIFGEAFKTMGRNLKANLADDRVRVIQGLWRR